MGLVEAAVHSRQLHSPDPRKSVEFMLSAMEGFKLQALFDPEICTKEGEDGICRGLMGIITGLGSDHLKGQER